MWQNLQEVEEQAMLATIDWGRRHPAGLQLQTRWSEADLEEAYQRCGVITSDYAKTFYLVRMHGCCALCVCCVYITCWVG